MQTQSMAVLFADVSGSTRLYETLGDTLALKKIGRCISLISDTVTENNGKVIKTIGDEVMSTFPGADAAVLAAAAIQQKIDQEFPEEGTLVKLRIGLHYGPVVIGESDVYGDSVNVASHLVKLANPGQILTSKETIDVLQGKFSSRTRDLGQFPVREKQETMGVFEILAWERKGDPGLTLSSAGAYSLEMPEAYLLLCHNDREIRVQDEGHTIVVGRDPENDLVIDDAFASRSHARIEYARGKFVLEDHSTNGTFVRMEKNETVYLRREKLLLRGKGEISLGRKFDDSPSEVIHFTCSGPEDS